MDQFHSQSGASLAELLVAIAIAIIVASTLSISFSTASKNMLLNRQRWIATSVANTQIQALKSLPYAYLDTTSLFGGANPTCDCAQLDYSTQPSTTTAVSGVAFTVASCVDFVTQGSWIPQCASAGDTGTKHIMVHVWWILGNSSMTVTQESLSTRY